MKATLLALLALVVIAASLFVSRQTSANDATHAESDSETIFVFIKIPESIMPFERVEKYEDPLDGALKKAGLGEATGGGSQLGKPGNDGTRDIEWVGIDVDLTDLSKGLPLLKSELRHLGAPSGTTIEYEINGKTTSEAL